MNISQKETNGTPLPKRVQQLIASNRRRPTFHVIAQMDEQDVVALKSVVAHDVALPEGALFHRAVAALVDKEKSPEVGSLLTRLVSDESENIRNRVYAAAELARFKPDTVEQGLIKNLRVSDPLLKTQIVKTLGCIGGTAALAKLDELPESPQAYTKKQVVFAKALISYRLGLDRDDLPFIQGKERLASTSRELINLSLRKMKKNSVASNLKKLLGWRYGIDLSDGFGFGLDAGKSHWALFINRQLQGERLFSAIKRRKYITGLLSLQEARTNTFAVQYIVLTNPKEQELDISVVRTDGEVFYTGKADLSGGILRFRMFDVERKGTAPTNVQGRLTTKGIEIDVCIPFGKRTNKRKARPFA